MTKTLRTLGILTLVSVAITFLCAFGSASSETTGVWAIITMGLAVAQSIVGIVQYNKAK